MKLKVPYVEVPEDRGQVTAVRRKDPALDLLDVVPVKDDPFQLGEAPFCDQLVRGIAKDHRD